MILNTELRENGDRRYAVTSDDGIYASSTGVHLTDSRYGNEWVKCACIGGVGTQPEYRRGGCVRMAFDAFFKDAKEHPEWAVSLLHPFSFPYYRQMGYEKISYHTAMEMPLPDLDMFPRFADFTPYRDELEGALVDLFNRFAKGRNMMFRRTSIKDFPLRDGAQLYLRMEGGKATAFVLYRIEDRFVVNRMIGDRLTVVEYGFDSPKALKELLGFLRMFDGQVLRVRFADTYLAPEIDMTLRHYHSVSYETLPDMSAKILNLKAMLEAQKYPKAPGAFVLREAGGETFRVEYENGQAQVKVSSLSPDVICDSPALARILYGVDPLTAERLRYMPGVEVSGETDDLIRAFPVCAGGVFEHF